VNRAPDDATELFLKTTRLRENRKAREDLHDVMLPENGEKSKVFEDILRSRKMFVVSHRLLIVFLLFFWKR